MTDIEQQPLPELPEEEVFYEEAPKSSLREGISMFISLLALVVIGFTGYVWLTPGLEFSDYLPGSGQADIAMDPAAQSAADHAAMHGMDTASEEPRCPTCNMFALRSASAIMADWSDGTQTHHDSWDCVANWAGENGITLAAAEVRDIASAGMDAVWLDASTAHYRFGTTEPIPGSMPPNIAAYGNYLLAQADTQRGGEVMDYTGLLAELGIDSGEPESGAAANVDPEDLPAMDHSQHSVDEMTSAADTKEAESAETEAASLHARAGFTDSSCPVCGMFADRSMTHVVVSWSDGTFSQHDCFDCAFVMLAEGAAEISAIEVSIYDPDNPGGLFVDARSAVFLYDTKRIKGSMAPFVAAFHTEDDALAAMDELGGELVNYKELAARWQQ